MRIVFMGTPDFAAASLKKLIDDKFDVIGVYTQPDKPKGRGMATGFSPVKELAVQNGIPVYQPERIKNDEAKEFFKSLGAELLVVVAYGKILPDEFIYTPKYGTINVHGSLLPKYRGSAPIQWSVLNGDDIAGVTTMYVASETDSGDIIYQESTPVGEFETSGELFDRLKDIGAELLARTIRDIEAGTAPRTPQELSKVTFTVQLDKSMSPIDWNKPARSIVKHIYGLQPWPVATMELDGTTLKVYAAGYGEPCDVSTAPGTLLSAGKDGLRVACAGGETVVITQVQAPGKKRMDMSAYLLGHPVRL